MINCTYDLKLLENMVIINNMIMTSILFSNMHHLSILTTLFLILMIIVPLSNTENPYYTAWFILYSCGNLQNVGYPFWGRDRPKFCGHIKLRCKNNDQNYYTIISPVHNNGYLLLGINASAHTLAASPLRLLERCYSEDTSNMTMLSPLMRLDDTNHSKEIRVFYACTNCDSKDHQSFACSYKNGTKGTAYYFHNPEDINGIGSESCSCMYSLSASVDKRALVELQSSNASLLSVLSKWPTVEMEYDTTFTSCAKCRESGGRCGSSSSDHNQFACHCRDGSQPMVCAAHLSGWQRKSKFFVPGVAAIVAGIIILIALVICARREDTKKLSFLWSKRTKGDQSLETFLRSYGSLVPKRYTYANVRKITSSFKEKLGEGGYGSVYKGQLHDGRLVAVKILKNLKGNGKDFINEVLSISRTNHVNVVTLLGFCFEGTKRAIIFEYLSKGSLEKFMYGKETSHSLQWDTMLNIALGIARGLDYLHRGCATRILHFDIKPHNILLDKDFNPKISDFGLARLCSPKNSMISMSEARGTIGYIAPEVFCRNFGGVSYKSDVYSYGMMILDLVCGRINSNSNDTSSSEMYFPEWVYHQPEPNVELSVQGIENGDRNDLERKMILVGLWCIQTYPSNRPPMSRVVEMLEGPLESLQMPPNPVSQVSSPTRCVSDSSLVVSS